MVLLLYPLNRSPKNQRLFPNWIHLNVIQLRLSEAQFFYEDTQQWNQKVDTTSNDFLLSGMQSHLIPVGLCRVSVHSCFGFVDKVAKRIHLQGAVKI